MPNRLELPDELAALVEKRDQERRQAERREAHAAANGDEPDRRSAGDRRNQPRRAEDKTGE